MGGAGGGPSAGVEASGGGKLLVGKRGTGADGRLRVDKPHLHPRHAPTAFCTLR